MKSKINLIILILFAMNLFLSCSKSIAPAGSATGLNQPTGGAEVPSPPCIVYKTKADYNNYVPVILSENKSKIISYPDIKDVYFKGELAYPTQLTDGYLLDNRGIGPDVAFLKYTYEAYSKLDRTPTADELMNNLLDKDPVKEMYDCGSRSHFADPVKELNALIKSGGLQDSKRIK